MFPTGADMRYHVSQDGKKIQESHQIHVSYLEFKRRDPKDKTAMTFRTAFLDDAPEDMDVANTLMMGGVPSIIATTNFTYRIEPDGTPVYMQPTKEFLKSVKK